MRLALAATAALALLSTAGGVVPAGMGAWQSDGRGIIPLNTRVQKYRFDAGFDRLWRDRITFAVADIDREFPLVWFVYASGTCNEPYQLHFDVDASAAPPECSDDIAGNCILAKTTCGTGGEYVGTGYRVCNLMRVRVYTERIRVVAEHKGEPLDAYAHRILRHEMGHVLGLPEVNNLGSEVSACSRALVTAYVNDPAIPEWTFLPSPPECQ